MGAHWTTTKTFISIVVAVVVVVIIEAVLVVVTTRKAGSIVKASILHHVLELLVSVVDPVCCLGPHYPQGRPAHKPGRYTQPQGLLRETFLLLIHVVGPELGSPISPISCSCHRLWLLFEEVFEGGHF